MDQYERIKEKLGISDFNKMQEEAFKKIPSGNDILILALTGSGKTLAFLLPLMFQLDLKIKRTQLLVVAPTRELALQITSVAQNLALGFNIQCCYGGHPVRTEKKSLLSNPEIIIGTPGRLLDHLERGHIDPLVVKFLVLDEFDKTLEMGFHKQMEALIKQFRYKPQYILTSATDAITIPDFVPLYEPVHINHIQDQSIESLQLYKVLSPSKDKLDTLFQLVLDIGNRSTFIFCNYRESVLRISEHLTEKGIGNDYFHGGLDQIVRENVLSKFRNGSTKILVTTDLAGRGLDIPQVANVIHYHLPSSEETFIHRNGRTARMNESGNSYVIISEKDQIPSFIDIVKSIYEIKTGAFPLHSPKFKTVMINKGKRDKIRKIDVVGFLSKNGNLDKGELGLVEVKENYSLAGVSALKSEEVIKLTNNKKIKGKKALVKAL